MFTPSLLALSLSACCFASLANNAPSRALQLPKKEFSLKYWILLTQALFMFCRQNKVALSMPRMKNLVAFVCVAYFISFLSSTHEVAAFLHLPILSGKTGLQDFLPRGEDKAVSKFFRPLGIFTRKHPESLLCREGRG